MPLECHARVESADEETAWVRWEVRAPEREAPLAAGRVAYDLETVQFQWEGGRPPGEWEFLIRTAVDRAVRARPERGEAASGSPGAPPE